MFLIISKIFIFFILSTLLSLFICDFDKLIYSANIYGNSIQKLASNFSNKNKFSIDIIEKDLNKIAYSGSKLFILVFINLSPYMLNLILIYFSRIQISIFLALTLPISSYLVLLLKR